MIQQVEKYRPDYEHPPTPALVRAANELKNFSPGFELSGLTEKGVFDLAWRALEKFCRVEVDEYIHPQSEEEKAAIFAGIELPENTEPPEKAKAEIIGKFDDVYRAAISGLTLILTRGTPVKVPAETVTHFGAALHEEIDQTLPGAYDGYILDQLILESMTAKNDYARGMTRAVTTETTRERMWQILSSVDEFAKYQKYLASPAELKAKADAVSNSVSS